MSDATKIQARFQSFTADFLHPLLAGGSTIVGRPLTPGMLEHFSLAVSADVATDREIYDLLHGEASEVAPLRGAGRSFGGRPRLDQLLAIGKPSASGGEAPVVEAPRRRKPRPA